MTKHGELVKCLLTHGALAEDWSLVLSIRGECPLLASFGTHMHVCIPHTDTHSYTLMKQVFL